MPNDRPMGAGADQEAADAMLSAPPAQGAAATDSKATLVRRAKWLRENREAFAFWDRDFEENGLPLAEFQQF